MPGPPSPINDFGFIQLQSAEVYEYEPLPGINYIRRVKLHPGTFEEAIVVSLEVVPFSEDQRPEYEALSYVWGSAEQPEIVRVDETYGLAISATRNLATALKYLRRADEPRTLWIDALCINQTDEVEKGPQVAMMGDIYRHATRVVVWLGPEADNSDMIFAKMAYLGSQIQVDFTGKVEIGLAEGATELGLADPSKPVYFWVEEFDALVHLFSRAWFSRLWIRQEIHLASPAAVITCGHSQVPWPVFLRAFALIIHQQIQVVDNREAGGSIGVRFCRFWSDNIE
ncbi:putative ankyrin and het domain protein [Diaporthe ampelina]|uniref:Putative ankyrin and het domain protein n=1 Tax=Diaporthe ampelina TaxID=1214573 RepID=A0A0G2FQA9_9PEZI|nr:putative ankyrin and het domain protein [Diaporthe ampelina]